MPQQEVLLVVLCKWKQVKDRSIGGSFFFALKKVWNNRLYIHLNNFLTKDKFPSIEIGASFNGWRWRTPHKNIPHRKESMPYCPRCEGFMRSWTRFRLPNCSKSTFPAHGKISHDIKLRKAKWLSDLLRKSFKKNFPTLTEFVIIQKLLFPKDPGMS